MTASYKASSQGTLPNATTHVLTLPAGLTAGDWVLAAASGGASAAAFDWSASGMTVLVNAVMGTGRWIVAHKALTAGDVAAGSWTVAASSAQYGVWGIVAYGGCAGFGTPSTPTYRGASGTSITALGATLATGQKALVVRAEKATNNPGPATSVPAITSRMARFSNGVSLASLVIGEYVAPAATVVFTDPVASANGVGFQVPIIDATVPDTTLGTVSVWDGTTEVTGCVVSVWDGTTEVALGSGPGASKIAVWDGTAEIPI